MGVDDEPNRGQGEPTSAIGVELANNRARALTPRERQSLLIFHPFAPLSEEELKSLAPLSEEELKSQPQKADFVEGFRENLKYLRRVRLYNLGRTDYDQVEVRVKPLTPDILVRLGGLVREALEGTNLPDDVTKEEESIKIIDEKFGTYIDDKKESFEKAFNLLDFLVDQTEVIDSSRSTQATFDGAAPEPAPMKVEVERRELFPEDLITLIGIYKRFSSLDKQKSDADTKSFERKLELFKKYLNYEAVALYRHKLREQNDPNANTVGLKSVDLTDQEGDQALNILSEIKILAEGSSNISVQALEDKLSNDPDIKSKFSQLAILLDSKAEPTGKSRSLLMSEVGALRELYGMTLMGDTRRAQLENNQDGLQEGVLQIVKDRSLMDGEKEISASRILCPNFKGEEIEALRRLANELFPEGSEIWHQVPTGDFKEYLDKLKVDTKLYDKIFELLDAFTSKVEISDNDIGARRVWSTNRVKLDSIVTQEDKALASKWECPATRELTPEEKRLSQAEGIYTKLAPIQKEAERKIKSGEQVNLRDDIKNGWYQNSLNRFLRETIERINQERLNPSLDPKLYQPDIIVDPLASDELLELWDLVEKLDRLIPNNLRKINDLGDFSRSALYSLPGTIDLMNQILDLVYSKLRTPPTPAPTLQAPPVPPSPSVPEPAVAPPNAVQTFQSSVGENLRGIPRPERLTPERRERIAKAFRKIMGGMGVALAGAAGVGKSAFNIVDKIVDKYGGGFMWNWGREVAKNIRNNPKEFAKNVWNNWLDTRLPYHWDPQKGRWDKSGWRGKSKEYYLGAGIGLGFGFAEYVILPPGTAKLVESGLKFAGAQAGLFMLGTWPHRLRKKDLERQYGHDPAKLEEEIEKSLRLSVARTEKFRELLMGMSSAATLVSFSMLVGSLGSAITESIYHPGVSSAASAVPKVTAPNGGVTEAGFTDPMTGHHLDSPPSLTPAPGVSSQHLTQGTEPYIDEETEAILTRPVPSVGSGAGSGGGIQASSGESIPITGVNTATTADLYTGNKGIGAAEVFEAHKNDAFSSYDVLKNDAFNATGDIKIKDVPGSWVYDQQHKLQVDAIAGKVTHGLPGHYPTAEEEVIKNTIKRDLENLANKSIKEAIEKNEGVFDYSKVMEPAHETFDRYASQLNPEARAQSIVNSINQSALDFVRSPDIQSQIGKAVSNAVGPNASSYLTNGLSTEVSQRVNEKVNEWVAKSYAEALLWQVGDIDLSKITYRAHDILMGHQSTYFKDLSSSTLNESLNRVNWISEYLSHPNEQIFREITVPRNTDLSHILQDYAVAPATYDRAYDKIIAAHLVVNYNTFYNMLDDMIKSGEIDTSKFAISKVEFPYVVKAALNGDQHARKLLYDAVHYLPAGAKLKLLYTTGFNRIMTKLGID